MVGEKFECERFYLMKHFRPSCGDWKKVDTAVTSAIQDLEAI